MDKNELKQIFETLISKMNKYRDISGLKDSIYTKLFKRGSIHNRLTADVSIRMVCRDKEGNIKWVQEASDEMEVTI